MPDLMTMAWKEVNEFLGNLRSARVFLVAVLLMGVLPSLEHTHVNGAAAAGSILLLVRLIYVMLAAMIAVAQTAPDLVLHERVGRTLDYLLTTRLPDSAIFGGKVLVAAAIGYLAVLASIGVQLVVSTLFSGGWSWLFLTLPEGRIIAFGLTAALCVYVAVIGTFVALRVGDQRAAYLVTVLCVGVLAVPFILGWLHIQLTAGWLGQAALVFGAFDVVLAVAGVLAFRREMLVLYLQE